MSDDRQGTEVSRAKNAGILAGWIAAMLLIAGMVWFFTQPFRNQLMLTAVNQVLTQSGDGRILLTPLPSAAIDSNSPRVGFWYTMSGGGRAFVFLFIANGTFFPALAVLDPVPTAPQVQPEVQFIPLNDHGARVLARICHTVLEIYSRRIAGGQL